MQHYKKVFLEGLCKNISSLEGGFSLHLPVWMPERLNTFDFHLGPEKFVACSFLDINTRAPEVLNIYLQLRSISRVDHSACKSPEKQPLPLLHCAFVCLLTAFFMLCFTNKCQNMLLAVENWNYYVQFSYRF